MKELLIVYAVVFGSAPNGTAENGVRVAIPNPITRAVVRVDFYELPYRVRGSFRHLEVTVRSLNGAATVKTYDL